MDDVGYQSNRDVSSRMDENEPRPRHYSVLRGLRGVVCLALVYLMAGCSSVRKRSEIELTLMNRQYMHTYRGEFLYDKITWLGIPVDRNVVVAWSCGGPDNATDGENLYYWYMREKNMVGLVTEKEFTPVKPWRLHRKMRAFARDLEEAIAKDGGAKAIIEGYKNGNQTAD